MAASSYASAIFGFPIILCTNIIAAAVQTPAVDIAASPSPDSEEELPAISAYQANLLHALYDAFVCQEESNLKAALKNWGIAQFEAIVLQRRMGILKRTFLGWPTTA